MAVRIRKRANNNIAKLLVWIEDENTPHAAEVWLKKFYSYLEYLHTINVPYPICKDPSLAKFDYHYFTYNDKWIVAYKRTGKNFIVYRFILGSRLNY